MFVFFSFLVRENMFQDEQQDDSIYRHAIILFTTYIHFVIFSLNILYNFYDQVFLSFQKFYKFCENFNFAIFNFFFSSVRSRLLRTICKIVLINLVTTAYRKMLHRVDHWRKIIESINLIQLTDITQHQAA